MATPYNMIAAAAASGANPLSIAAALNHVGVTTHASLPSLAAAYQQFPGGFPGMPVLMQGMGGARGASWSGHVDGMHFAMHHLTTNSTPMGASPPVMGTSPAVRWAGSATHVWASLSRSDVLHVCARKFCVVC